LIAGDLRRRIDRCFAPREAELHLVLAGEVAGITACVVLRPRRVEEVVGVVPDVCIILVEVLVAAADRVEREPARDVRVSRGRKELLAEDEVAFTLVQGRRAGLVPRRLDEARRADAAAVLLLVAAEERKVRADRVVEDAVGLERLVLQLRLVELARERQVANVGVAERAPGEEAILEDRPADVEALIEIPIRSVALAAGAAERGPQIRLALRRLQP